MILPPSVVSLTRAPEVGSFIQSGPAMTKPQTHSSPPRSKQEWPAINAQTASLPDAKRRFGLLMVLCRHSPNQDPNPSSLRHQAPDAKDKGYQHKRW